MKLLKFISSAAVSAVLFTVAFCITANAEEPTASEPSLTVPAAVTEETVPSETAPSESVTEAVSETAVITSDTVQTSLTDVTDVTETTVVSTTETSQTTTVTTPENGWFSSGGKWYYYQNGRPSTGVRLINGESYIFATNGVLQTGWQTIKSVRKFFDYETGQPVYGWVTDHDRMYYCDKILGKLVGMNEIDGEKYIFDKHGILLYGFVKYENCMYYCGENGAVVKGDLEKTPVEINGNYYIISPVGRVNLGWQTVNGIRLFYDYNTAVPQTGWIKYNGRMYYSDMETGKYTGDHDIDGHPFRFDSKGIIMTEFQTFEGNLTCYFYANGTYATGLQKISGNYYYFDENGYMCYGWQTIGSKNYYFDLDGKAVIGLYAIDGETYYFANDGVMQTGLIYDGNDYYYADENGILQTGWQTVKSNKYYFAANGKGTIGWLKFSGDDYYFGTDAVMQTGFVDIDGKTYYFAENGKKQTGWQDIKNDRYYFDKSGVMYTYRHNIDGKNYCFYSNGAMVKEGNQDIAALAFSQLGNEGGRPYWTWCGFSYRIEWCACFVSWCAAHCGYTSGGDVPIFISCKVGIDWFKEHGQWKGRNHKPITGNYIFFDWDGDGTADHIGLVDYVEDGCVYTIEGNSSDMCRRKVYVLNDACIFGYAAPNYPN
ncbi:MAG: CHAP domain-containing protein [Oscillospiraceae bacterium]